ncbi:MAG: glycosyltransferase family 39 protein [Candidatus Omnitrophota bacterium]
MKRLFDNKIKVGIALLLFIGFFLRLSFSLTYLPILGVEEAHVIFVKSISLSLERFFFPLENVLDNHIILTDLPVLLGMKLFGENALGIRFFFVVLGFLNLILIYKFLAKSSRSIAIYALILLAFNQFHIAYSGIADNTGIILLLSTLSIYVFWEGVNYKRSMLWFLGLIWILSYMAQEQAVVFVPVFYLFLLTAPPYRKWASSKEIAFSYFVFIIFVASHLILIKTKGTSLEYFTQPGYVQLSFLPTFTGVNFFLIEPVSRILHLDYRMTVNCDAPLMSPLSGVVLFIGIIYSLKNLKGYFVRLLFLLAGTQIMIFTFIKTNSFIWGEAYWSKLSFMPAIILTAMMFHELAKKSRYVIRYLIYIILTIIFCEAIVFALPDKTTYPPHRFATFVDYDAYFIELYLNKGYQDKFLKGSLERMNIYPDYKKAMARCYVALDICPNEVRIHNYLAEGIYRSGFKKAAEKTWIRSLELDPFYAKTLESILSYNDRKSPFYESMGHLNKSLGFLKNKVPDLARKELREAKVENFSPALFHYYSGIIYISKGDLQKSESEISEAINSNPGFVQGIVDLARISLYKNELGKAEMLLTKAIKINPDSPLAYKYLSQIYALKGDSKLARDYDEKAENIIHTTLRRNYWEDKLFLYGGL